jgi:hypothetical protein
MKNKHRVLIDKIVKLQPRVLQVQSSLTQKAATLWIFLQHSSFFFISNQNTIKTAKDATQVHRKYVEHLTRKKKKNDGQKNHEKKANKSKPAARRKRVLKDFKSTTILLWSSKLSSFLSLQIHHKKQDSTIYHTATI